MSTASSATHSAAAVFVSRIAAMIASVPRDSRRLQERPNRSKSCGSSLHFECPFNQYRRINA
jgi:hypothetical protein